MYKYVLLVEMPSQGWAVWTWANDLEGLTYLESERDYLIGIGRVAKIYLEF